MAADEYHNTFAASHHVSPPYTRDPPLPPTPSSIRPLTTTYTDFQASKPSYTDSRYSASGSIDISYDNPQHLQDSYYQGAAGSTLQNDGQYADNIPLRSSNPRPDSLDSLGGATQYPPSPESQHPTGRTGRRKRKQGWFTGKITWVVYLATLVQVGVFIAEIVNNATKTGSPIMIRPNFNPMIGPSPYVLINMGARFVPCMRMTEGTQGLDFPCPQTTSSDPDDAVNHCTLPKLCGFGAPDNGSQPSQWFRFIIPMFLHAGLIHIGFNLLLQLTLGREMELEIGSFRFALVYFSSGVFGFVLGGNFAPPAIASTGASGCLFGILALVLLDLIYSWKERPKPGRELLIILIDIVISFALGLLPGLDNFSHIGGFLMGLVLGVCILHSPNVLRERIGVTPTPYKRMASGHGKEKEGMGRFVQGPIGFFKGRKPAWWAWWLLRVGALVAVLVSFILLLNNFYVYKKGCNWCKYLSCIDVNNWCDIGKIQPLKTDGSKVRRDMTTTAWQLGRSALQRRMELVKS